MFSTQFRKFSASGYTAQLQKAFETNALSVKYFCEYAVAEHEQAGEIGKRLMDNQTQLASLIGYFYRDRKNIVQAFSGFMQMLGDAIQYFKVRIKEDRIRIRWYEKADNLLKILDGVNDWYVREFFYKQISLMESMIKSYLKPDAIAQEFYYNELIINNRKAAMVFAQKIISQNNREFNA